MTDQAELEENVFAELEAQWDKEAESNFYQETVGHMSNIVNKYTGKTVRGLVALNIISDFYRSATAYPHILVDLDHFMVSFVENLQKRNNDISVNVDTSVNADASLNVETVD